MSGPQASASGESAEGLADQKEERKDQAPNSFGEVRNLSSLVVTFPTEEKEEEGSQEPEVATGSASPADILLSVVGSLRTCETSLLDETAVKLAGILQKEKTALKDKVSEIVEWLYWEISSIPVGRARRAALNVVTSLAEVSPEDVVSSLLKHSLPCSGTAAEVWRTLCMVPETNTKVLWYLLRELKRGASVPEHSCSAGGTTSYAESLAPLAVSVDQPCQALRALGEMLKLFTCMGAMQGLYPALLLAILTQIHFLICPRALCSLRRFTVDLLRILLLQDHNFKALLGLETNKVWGLLSSKEEHLRGVVLFARILAILTTHHLLGLLAEVIPQLDAQVEERALTAKALFAGAPDAGALGLRKQNNRTGKLTTRLIPKKRILAKLEQWQADPRLVVRWLSFQGLGNLALQKQKLKFLKGLVCKMLAGLNEADRKTVRDILKTLPKVLTYHRLRLYVGSMCLQVAEKLLPFLEDEREPERSLAVHLFGELLPCVNRWHKAQMRERILAHSVPFLFRLHDCSQPVADTYQRTLTRCSDLLGWNLRLDIMTLASYDCHQALDKICKSLVQWYPKKTPVFLTCTLDYLKSSEAPLRRAASIFAGFLAFYMDPWQLNEEDLIALQQGLDCLLTDPEPSVAQVASISILQVKEVRRRLLASALPVPSALAWMLCCIKSGEKEKPQFEESPFKRKRSPEAFLSVPQCSS
ncbi:maestro heat-like repeat-containing protein family member 6 [Vipera latastei]